MRFAKQLAVCGLILGFASPMVLGTMPAAASTSCSAPAITGSTAIVTCSYDGTTGADGTVQTWQVPVGVNYATFAAFGAQGGTGGGIAGGEGGEAQALFSVNPGDTYDVTVAGQGGAALGCAISPGPGGFGGGGAGGNSECPGAGGGGASSVYDGASALVVGGGGGGAANLGGTYASNGGSGGGLTGTAGYVAGDTLSETGGAPGTQSGAGIGTGTGGSGGPGQGGVGGADLTCGIGFVSGGGGGGGYYGGAGGDQCTGGGGGSGYVDSLASSSSYQTGVQAGNGVVTITYQLPPVVTGVYFEGSSSSPTIVITGSGLSNESDLGTPNDVGNFGSGADSNDYPNFSLSDNSAGINVGGEGDFIGIIPTSYSDTEIVLTLGDDYQISAGQPVSYSSYGFVAGDGYTLDLLGTSLTGTVAYYPTATISLPIGGGSYALGASVPTTFSCSDFPGGEGISTCADSNKSGTGSGLLDTSEAGNNTYTVTATSDEGFTGTASISYTVNQATPSISSTPNVTSVNLGSATPPVLTDTATISGGDNPGGTLNFTLFDTSSGTTVDTETLTSVNGNGLYSTPTGYTLPTGQGIAGLYQWEVTYTGDNNNAGVSDNTDPAEQVSVNDAQPTLSSTPTPATYTLGTSSGALKDAVTLSGGYHAQGTIVFTLVYNGTTVDTETLANVNGNGSYSTPTGYTLAATGTVTGTYQWNAQYSGDTNNASNDDNNATDEQVVVKGHSEVTSTSMNIAKGNVTYGAEAVQTINGVVTGQKNDGAPVGSVNVTYGTNSTPLCSATLVPGTGDTSTYKCALSPNTQLAAANYLSVRATFVPGSVSSTSPNFAYTTSMSGPFSGDNFLVKKDSTTTKVSVSPSSVSVGAESSATFSVVVTTASGESVPNNETVSVKVGTASCVVTLTAGKGTCTIANSALGAGSYSVSASYAGDTNLSSSSGSGPQFTVKKK
jgi:hypothetical protein